MTIKKIKLTRTRKGLPALWEEGGGRTNTGWARIIAGPSGEKMRPIYINRWGSLANGEHALFPVKPGIIVVEASHHREDFSIGVSKIVRIFEENQELYAEAEKIFYFDEGEWDQEPPESLTEAIKAVIEKATCYHCRSPHYAEPWEPPLPR